VRFVSHGALVAMTVLLVACDSSDTSALKLCEGHLVERLKNPKSYERLSYIISEVNIRTISDVRSEIKRVIDSDWPVADGFPDERIVDDAVNAHYSAGDTGSVNAAHVVVEFLASNSFGGKERESAYCLFSGDAGDTTEKWQPGSAEHFRHVWIKGR
jgi:hypothetical protein